MGPAVPSAWTCIRVERPAQAAEISSSAPHQVRKLLPDPPYAGGMSRQNSPSRPISIRRQDTSWQLRYHSATTRATRAAAKPHSVVQNLQPSPVSTNPTRNKHE